MKVKLIKTEVNYILEDDKGVVIASTSLKKEGLALSLKNCQAIENGYDLDELACNEIGIDISVINHIDNKVIENDYVSTPIHEAGALGAGLYHRVKGFEIGFQKALEILGDKKFSINEVVELCKILMSNPIEKCGKTYQELTDNYIQSLQQTEWDVEVEKENVMHDYNGNISLGAKFKLDADGCLILKLKSE